MDQLTKYENYSTQVGNNNIFQISKKILSPSDPRFVNAPDDASKTFENHQDDPQRQ